MAALLGPAFDVDTVSNAQSSVSEPDGSQSDVSVVPRRKSPLRYLAIEAPSLFQDESFESGNIDSGYGSTTTSTSGTPADKPKPSPKDIESDLVLAPARKLFARHEPTKVQVFDVPIPQLTQDSFDDLMELWSQSLCKQLAKGKTSPIGLSIKLRVVGESREVAKCCVLIQGDKKSSTKVKQFFNKRNVKEAFQANLPGVGIIVCERPPKPFAAIDVYGLHANLSTPTLCGLMINTGGDHNSKFATLGGVIKVTATKETKFYVLTTGHIVAHYKNQEVEIDSDHSDASEDFNDFADDDSTLNDEGSGDGYDGFWFEGEEVFELVHSSIGDHDTSTAQLKREISRLAEAPSWNSEQWSKVGQVSTFSQINTKETRNFDWALIELDDPSQYRPNVLPFDGSEGNLKLSTLEPESLPKGTKREVILKTGTSGQLEGQISAAKSYFLTAPGRSFVKAYDLVLKNEQGEA